MPWTWVTCGWDAGVQGGQSLPEDHTAAPRPGFTMVPMMVLCCHTGGEGSVPSAQLGDVLQVGKPRSPTE